MAGPEAGGVALASQEKGDAIAMSEVHMAPSRILENFGGR